MVKFKVNAAIQSLAVVAHVLNATIDVLPPRGRLWAMAALSLVQGAVAALAHFSNPDGTPAAAPYRKES
jgi:hypothetical protein